MKTKSKTPPPSFALPAAFLALASESVLLDPAAKSAIATDGEAIAILPLPQEFTGPARLVLLPVNRENGCSIEPQSGAPTEDTYDLTQLVTPAAYRIALNPAKLAALAAALGSPEFITLELPASPEDGPMLVFPAMPGTGAYGYLMPQPCDRGDKEGLLTESGAGNLNLKSEISDLKLPPPAALPPPTILATTRKETRLIEVNFHGKPEKEILQQIGRDGIGFSYSGQRGTKKGVPPCIWYAPDNEFFRSQIQNLLKIQVAA